MSERDVRCAGSEGAADLRGEAAISHETADGLGKEWPMALDMSNEQAAEILSTSNSGVVPDLSRHTYRVIERAFDIAASGVAIVLLLVPSVVLSVAIWAKSPGSSPLYSQTRVGRLRKDGSYKLFRMWKFRSMVPNADELLEELKEHNEADGPLFKIKDDPRIIPGVGKFIRKHSIDELPQLINVSVGDIPLRILKTRPEFSEESMGAFALPAKSSTNESKAFSQAAAAFAARLRMRRATGLHSNLTDDAEVRFLAKPIFGIFQMCVLGYKYANSAQVVASSSNCEAR